MPIKFLVLGGVILGFWGWGGGSADFIVMGAVTFLKRCLGPFFMASFCTPTDVQCMSAFPYHFL